MQFIRITIACVTALLCVVSAEASTYVTYDATIRANGTGYDRPNNRVYPVVLNGNYVVTLDLSGLNSASTGFFNQGTPLAIVYINPVQNAWGMIAQDLDETTRSIFLTLRDGALANGLFSQVLTGDALSANISLPNSLYAQGGVALGTPVLTSLTTTFSSTAPVTGIGSRISETVSIASVPEPATWFMMVAGLGIAGAMIRRRRTSAVCTHHLDA